MTMLYVKSLLVRTPLERPAQRLRDFAGIVERRKNPELHEIHVEHDRIEQAMQQIVYDGMNCIDIGCHIGSSLSSMLHYSPRGRHIAFEPIPGKAQWLRRKFPEVQVRELALGEKRERLTFFQNVSRPGFSGFAKGSATEDEIVEQIVDCEMLDNVAGADRNFGFIKIDVEGAEILVLKRGASVDCARQTDHPL